MSLSEGRMYTSEKRPKDACFCAFLVNPVSFNIVIIAFLFNKSNLCLGLGASCKYIVNSRKLYPASVAHMLRGDVEHGDSMGNKGVISLGDTQWMTAGSGVIHIHLFHKSPAFLPYSRHYYHERSAAAGYRDQPLWFLLPPSARVRQVCSERDAQFEGALVPGLFPAIKTSIPLSGLREKRGSICPCSLTRSGGRASKAEMRPGPAARFVVQGMGFFCRSLLWCRAGWR